MKQYSIDSWTGKIHFDNARVQYSGRVRTPRVRAQKLFCRFGGNPFLPFRIAHYTTPAFYYSELMRHRRKKDLDDGLCKLEVGRWRSMMYNLKDEGEL